MKRQNKLGSYLAVTAGVGCAASVAEGAVVVTYFPPGIATRISVSGAGPSHTWEVVGLGGSYVVTSFDGGAFNRWGLKIFVQNSDEGYNNTGFTVGTGFAYYQGAIAGAVYGAVVDGATLNFMAVDFTGDDTVRESVAAFVFDGVGGGYIHAVARNDDNSTMSITDGIVAITAAAVPEPSSLALLALGSVGLAARRRRKAA